MPRYGIVCFVFFNFFFFVLQGKQDSGISIIHWGIAASEGFSSFVVGLGPAGPRRRSAAGFAGLATRRPSMNIISTLETFKSATNENGMRGGGTRGGEGGGGARITTLKQANATGGMHVRRSLTSKHHDPAFAIPTPKRSDFQCRVFTIFFKRDIVRELNIQIFRYAHGGPRGSQGRTCLYTHLSMTSS